MDLTIDHFESFHSAVHGPAPFEWQSRLLREVVEKKSWPRVLDLPTGSGKTTCIDIALFALALDAAEETGKRWCPRRIAMVVDRRVVVDQAADRGRKLLQALTQPAASQVVRDVAARLRSLSHGSDDPLRVFTLRGGIPKDDGWARTPDQPLILASTVDQLGSRLLIQGYGVTDSMKPIHAGLLANDILILLDEVHLSQPFAETLEQIVSLRRRFAGSSIPPRFHSSFLSATPGQTEIKPFCLTDKEQSLDSPLGTRLNASKPARLVEVADRAALQAKSVEEADALLERHDVIVVVVNRVASASMITSQLRERLKGRAEVRLITGRMRPLERDDVLRDLRPRIGTGRDRSQSGGKLVVVGTQSLEAGADFDFDAIVTEAASLDSLRQRFGRVDRLGSYGRAEGVVIGDKSSKNDPVYGDALSKTVAWFKKQTDKKTTWVDFGVRALPLPDGEELSALLAPRSAAPILMPAYLDLWMQSSPKPVVVPDVSLWLHGADSGPADVQVVWRADITENDLQGARNDSSKLQRLISIVAAIRPSSLEAMAIPFTAARRWLAGEDVADIADVEGGIELNLKGRMDVQEHRNHLALRWLGDESRIVEANGVRDGALRPGDTIVIPAARGGIGDFSFNATSHDAVPDLAERAAFTGRARPVLRLHPEVLKGLGLSIPIEELPETRASLRQLAESYETVGWKQYWLQSLAKSRRHFAVEGLAESLWTVIEGDRISINKLRALMSEEEVEDGLDLTTDPEESCFTGRSVELEEHSRNVERFARGFARAVGVNPQMAEDIALAGWLHDIGKVDPRFQLLLRGGSEIELFKDGTPWAKSGVAAGAKAAQRLAQRRSQYPVGARHEVQSIAMLGLCNEFLESKAHDVDLVLYLVASHHGYCRPFAPVSDDQSPVSIALRNHLSDAFGNLDCPETTSINQLYKLDSPLADRFWKLVERYGWFELCWLEAILRLADHRASEEEQKGVQS
jgi:CRISPR-associated endonuclease/helicase Cas3